MYAKFTGLDKKLKQHHHINIDSEFRFNCEIWRLFLTNYKERSVCRPMIDLKSTINATQLSFYSDASANERLGFGAVYGTKWLYGQ